MANLRHHESDLVTVNGSVACESSTRGNASWVCMSLGECKYNQTSAPRSQTGRKCVSDYFGRNKAQTRQIPAEVWNWRCRKCYQHGIYNTNKKTSSPEVFRELITELIQEQLDRLRIWRPAALFTIQLRKPAKGKRTSGMRSTKRGKTTSTVGASQQNAQGSQSDETSPSNTDKTRHIAYIKKTFLGKGKTYTDIEEFLAWTERMFAGDGMLSFPPVEFLMSRQAVGEQHTDPSTNLEMYLRVRRKNRAGSPEESVSTSKVIVPSRNNPTLLRRERQLMNACRTNPMNTTAIRRSSSGLRHKPSPTDTVDDPYARIFKTPVIEKTWIPERLSPGSDVRISEIPLWQPPPPVNTRINYTSLETTSRSLDVVDREEQQPVSGPLKPQDTQMGPEERLGLLIMP